ncbi:hypothetical protein ACFX1Z_032571 [Malus domestica]
MPYSMVICKKRFICISFKAFVNSQYPTHVCRMVRFLYRVKQAPRAWHSKFTGVLPSLGFIVSQSDASLSIKYDGTLVMILLLYVDDIIIIGSDASQVQTVITTLGELLELKDMGKLTYFLGLHSQYEENGDMFINQAKYATYLLKKAGMDTCKPAPTPAKPHS